MQRFSTEPAPSSLVNSSMAMVPALCGLVTYDTLVSGRLSFTTIVALAFFIQTICLCFFWQRFHSRSKKNVALITSVPLHWGYIAAVTATFFGNVMVSNPFVILPFIGFGVAAIVFMAISSKSKRDFSANILSVFGVIVASTAGWSAFNISEATPRLTKPFNVHQGASDADRFTLNNKTTPDGETWNYAGANGPENWHKVNDAYSQCATGNKQSPIDISAKTPMQSFGLNLLYGVSSGLMTDLNLSAHFNIEGDHTMVLESSKFRLKEIHFHSPSEHTINGLKYPLEFQFTHSDANGKTSILTTFVEKGKNNVEYDKLISSLSKQNAQRDFSELKLKNLLPNEQKYWRYSGSMTTPPCSEGIDWVVLAKPMELSESQIESFRSVHTNNARPIQPANNRLQNTDTMAIAH